MSLETILSAGAPLLGVPLDSAQVERFRAYYELLRLRGGEFNLTAILGEEEAARLHFLDCLGILRAWDFAGKSVIDVGTGAGFPGYPMKLAEPTLALTLVDSTEKKVRFLREVSERIGVEAECIDARAEELGRGAEHRGRYDAAVSRAVARMSVLCELCLPLVKPGGVFVAMKGADSDGELDEAMRAMEELGGAKPEIFTYRIPDTDVIRRAVVVKKVRETPDKYPRRYARIQKSPL